jgi:two-component system, chemotaxis family, sensor kinase CheA
MSTAAGRRRLLFVEDSAFFRNMLTPVLKAAGYDVTTATNGKEALALVERDAFDLVVSDIEMPEMDGFALAEALRAGAQTQALPIIALTSHTSPTMLDRGRRAGFRAFVAKFDRQGLIAALKEAPLQVSKAA